jgi:hypothetical protein
LRGRDDGFGHAGLPKGFGSAHRQNREPGRKDDRNLAKPNEVHVRQCSPPPVSRKWKTISASAPRSDSTPLIYLANKPSSLAIAWSPL